MLHEGGRIMSRLNKYLIAVITVLVCFTVLPFLSACGNSGPINPDMTDVEGENLDDPIKPPGDDDVVNNDSREEVEGLKEYEPDFQELSITAIQQLTEALDFLRDSDGGVMSIPLQEDQFVIHIYDGLVGGNLTGQAVIKCDGGPTSLVDIHGLAMFEGATFPMTVTVFVETYALETIVNTEANLLSIAMQPTVQPEPAFLFGVSETLGSSEMLFYDDNLLPNIYNQGASLRSPEYLNFEIEVSPNEKFGFSGFMTGEVDFGETIPDPPYQWSPMFFMAKHLAWDFSPIKEGDRMFYYVKIDSTQGPDGLEQSMVGVPAEIWNIVEPEGNDYAEAYVLPTAILLDGYRYMAMGSRIELEGEDPGALDADWHWWEAPIMPDRTVLAGHLLMSDGAVDIVHMDWHPESDAPDLNFSGVARLGIAGGMGIGLTFPMFAFTDPIGVDTDLIRINVEGYNYGPVWNITCEGGLEVLNTADFSTPLTWLAESYNGREILYQAEYINSFGMEIDDYSTQQIVMNRRETCFSPWEAPQM